MFKKFFQQIRFRMLARQLRQPAGKLGNKVGRMMNKANEFLYDFTWGIIQPAANQSILEIGFGNGQFFDQLFSRAEHLKIYGLDFSETMFRTASESNKKAIGDGRLELHFGNSDQLPFAANRFDAIYCINVIYFWDQPPEHLQEIYRVLKQGGRFYATVRTKESMQKMPFTKYGFHFYESEQWKQLFSDAGLSFIGEYPVDEPPVDTTITGFDQERVIVQSLCVVAEKKG